MVDLREDTLRDSAEEIAKSVGVDKVLAIAGDLSNKDFCGLVKKDQKLHGISKLDLFVNEKYPQKGC